MDNLILVVFFCIVIPIGLTLFLVDKKSRMTLGFLILGMCACLFISAVNSFILKITNFDRVYVTTNLTPVTEELIKFFVIFCFAVFVSRKTEELINVSLATGIGFAIFENVVLILSGSGSSNLAWAITRSFAASLMHGVCTALVGYGLSFVGKKRKFLVSGTFALLTAAISYHAIFNVLVQSEYSYIGFVMPLLTYIPFIIAYRQQKKGSGDPNSS
ncbi:MAG: PrsW family intramembrane metalloprotease [Parasporobacterium sp.]|nr:PrsW family intramembrane metalloprotease [Parasporobacterium sp.]